MRFLMIPGPLNEKPDDAAPEPDLHATMLVAHMKYNEEMYKAGVLVASEGLNPDAKSAHIKMTRGKRTVVDGPFAETKELIAGFWMIDVKSREEAIEWAMRCPQTPGRDEVLEIRPLTGPADLPEHVKQLIIQSAPTWSAAFTASR